MLLFSLFLALIVLACGVPAFAAEMLPAHPSLLPASSGPAALALFLRETLFPVLAALLMGVITPLIYRLGAKFKIDALTQKDNFLERIAFQGITLAEERAAQLIGSKSALTGSNKLDIAVAHVLGIMPKVSEEQARAMVHALLAQLPGVGASGQKAVAFPGAATPSVNFLPGDGLLFDPDTILAAPPSATK